MQDIKNKLIVALDVDTLEKAKYFVELLSPIVKFFKVGSQLFTACGPDAVKAISEKGAQVFLDLKFHDIPNTVYSSILSATASGVVISATSGGSVRERVKNAIRYPVFMMTVHTLGGKEMLERAVKGALDKAAELHIEKPRIVGVTRLTSDETTRDTLTDVLQASRLAQAAGLDGVVCSPDEASAVRKEFGKDFIIVTPGIRAKGAKRDDQKRVATAAEAVAAGADYLVVGRPVLAAADPVKAVEELYSAGL